MCRFLQKSAFDYYYYFLMRIAIACTALALPWVVTRLLGAPNYPALFGVAIISLSLYVPVVFIAGFTRDERGSVLAIVWKNRSHAPAHA